MNDGRQVKHGASCTLLTLSVQCYSAKCVASVVSLRVQSVVGCFLPLIFFFCFWFFFPFDGVFVCLLSSAFCISCMLYTHVILYLIFQLVPNPFSFVSPSQKKTNPAQNGWKAKTKHKRVVWLLQYVVFSPATECYTQQCLSIYKSIHQ